MSETPASPLAGPPPWLDQTTLRAMEAAKGRALAWGRDAMAAAEAAREVALAHYPALPLPMIAEAVAVVVPDPCGVGAGAGHPLGGGERTADGLRPAGEDDLAQALSYALRFDDRGKPRRTGADYLAPLAAAQLAAHLVLAGFVVMRRPALPPHTPNGR